MRIRTFRAPAGAWLQTLAVGLTLLFPGCAGHDGGGARDLMLGAILDAEDARGTGPAGMGPLLEGLASGDAGVQAVAVRALGRLEDPDRVDLISPLLSSPHPEVRAEAANALGQAVFSADGDGVAAILLDHLGRETDPGVRGVVGRTLGRLRYGDPQGLPATEAALLALTLEGTGDAPVQSLLGGVMGLEWLARLNREEGLSQGATDRLRVLVSYGLRANGAADPEAAPRVRRVALMALAAAGGGGEETLRAALADPDPDVRRLAVAAVGRSPSFGGGLERLAESLGDPSPRVRTQAVAAFAALAPAHRRCAPLLDAARDDELQVALAALDLLGEPCPDPAPQILALRGFAEEAAASPARWHRGAHALLALARVSPGTASPLLPAYAGHESPFARAYAAQAAALAGDGGVLEALAEDQVPNVRTAAVQGLFRLRGHEADEVLRAQLTQDEAQLLMTVAGLLEGTPSPGAAVTPLLEAFQRVSARGWETLRDPRMEILHRLAEVGGGEAAGGLEAYLSDYDPVVADRVAELLTAWTGEARKATPSPGSRVPVPSQEELRGLARSRVILEMEGGGEIEIRLFPDLAPTNAARFARLARSGALDGLTFHRVVSNFVIQGGSPDANEMSGHGAYTRDEIGLQSNWRGTVGTSTRGRDTGDGQLFVNLVDNLRLDHNYTVFGEVAAGMEVVDRVAEGQVILRARVVDR